MNNYIENAHHDFVQNEPQLPTSSFATMLRNTIGEEAWLRLHKAIRDRFQQKQSTHKLYFAGTMELVYCSPIGRLFAYLLKPFEIVPLGEAKDIKFSFTVEPQAGEIQKQRCYELNKQQKKQQNFTFASKFRESPFLHEEFKGGLGMKLALFEENTNLIFRDKGYFLKLGNWRLPIPAILSVGHFELLHRNIDQNRFQIIIRISHVLFGTLFYQRGEFYNLRKKKK